MTKKTYGHDTWEGLPSVREAKRMFLARKGKPTEADAPRRRGRGPKPMPGQLDIFGHVHGVPQEDDEELHAA